MFRKMHRPKQQLPEADCIEMLKTEPRGVLSLLGDDDYPYGIPMNHWYNPEDGKLYFHCGKVGHKLDALQKHSKVSFCVCDQGTRKEGDWALTFRSVIVFGKAKMVTDQEKAAEAIRQLCYKFTSDEAYINEEFRKFMAGTLCFALTPEHISGKTVHEA